MRSGFATPPAEERRRAPPSNARRRRTRWRQPPRKPPRSCSGRSRDAFALDPTGNRRERAGPRWSQRNPRNRGDAPPPPRPRAFPPYERLSFPPPRCAPHRRRQVLPRAHGRAFPKGPADPPPLKPRFACAGGLPLLPPIIQRATDASAQPRSLQATGSPRPIDNRATADGSLPADGRRSARSAIGKRGAASGVECRVPDAASGAAAKRREARKREPPGFLRRLRADDPNLTNAPTLSEEKTCIRRPVRVVSLLFVSRTHMICSFI